MKGSEGMEQRYERILVGMDGSDQAKDAFKKAIEVARRNQGEVVVAVIIEQQVPVMTMGYAPLSESILDELARQAQELIKECEEYATSVDFHQVTGVINYGSPKSLLAYELPKKYQIDLIMVGQSGLNAMERFVTGSVASYVILNAPCDVLIISSHQVTKE